MSQTIAQKSAGLLRQKGRKSLEGVLGDLRDGNVDGVRVAGLFWTTKDAEDTKVQGWA